MFYLIAFVTAMFIIFSGIIYFFLSQLRWNSLGIDSEMSSTFVDWSKEAFKQISSASEQFKRPTWLVGIYIALGAMGLIGGTLYFKTLPAGLLCGVLMFLVPEQVISQRLLANNNKLMEQLGMAVRIFTAEYRDTPHPVRALDVTSKKIPNPLGKVLKTTVREFNSGKSIDETLLNLSKKLNSPYGRLFIQLLRQSFDDNAVISLFVKLSARLGSRQDLVQENNKQISSNRFIVTAMNIAIVPAFFTVTRILPESYSFFTQDITGRLIIIIALSSAVGAVLMDRVLNGGSSFD